MQQEEAVGDRLQRPFYCQKGMTARKAVGTVDTSEFAIAFFGSLGFIISLGWEAVNWLWVVALIIGGVVAAPIAALLRQDASCSINGCFSGWFHYLNQCKNIISYMDSG